MYTSIDGISYNLRVSPSDILLSSDANSSIVIEAKSWKRQLALQRVDYFRITNIIETFEAALAEEQNELQVA